MNSRSDEELVAALGNGDEDALRLLVDRHAAAIYRFSVRHTGDELLAEDVSQEVFLRVYRNAHTFDSSRNFKAWLFTIVRNTSIEMARSAGYRRSTSLDPAEVEGDQSSHLHERYPDPEESYAAQETASRVATALQTLQEKQRTVVILKYFDGLSNREIADVIGSTVSSVESLLVRAKRNLAKLLG